MLVGAIEAASADKISGWIYSPLDDLRDKLVLAFLDGQCVGSGRIGLFRDDLAAAGLSHGHFGYHFGIVVPSSQDAKRVIVSLEACEAVIMPPGARIMSESAERLPSAYLGGELPDARQINWLRERKVVPASTHDLLEVLASFGVASQGLNDGETPEAVSQAIFEASILREVKVGVLELSASSHFMTDLVASEEAADAGLFVLGCDRRVTLNAVESAEVEPPGDEGVSMDNSAGGIDYVLDQKRLLVIRRWTRNSFRRMVGERIIKVYYPTLPTPAVSQAASSRKIEA